MNGRWRASGSTTPTSSASSTSSRCRLAIRSTASSRSRRSSRSRSIPPWSVRYGFQLEGERQAELDEFTSTRNAGVVAEVRNPNLFGRALTGGVFGMYQRDRRDASVFLATSRLFGWRARSTLYGFYSRDRFRDPDTSRSRRSPISKGVSADQRWRTQGLPDRLRLSLRAQSHVRSRAPSTIRSARHRRQPREAERARCCWIAATIRSTRARARSARSRSINAALFLGSDVQNRKLLMQQFVFVPLGRLVLASRVQAGFAFGRDPLSFTDRFRAGGATSVRGYGEESLGPRDVDSLPSGGDRLMILNQEARFPMYRWVNGVAFIDAGNIFAKGEDWNGLEDRLRIRPAPRYAGRTDPRRRRLPEQPRDRRAEVRGSTSASDTSSSSQ